MTEQKKTSRESQSIRSLSSLAEEESHIGHPDSPSLLAERGPGGEVHVSLEQLPSKMPRRDFLGLAWGLAGGLAAAGMGFVGLRFVASQVGAGDFGGVIEAGAIDDFLPGTVTPVLSGRFYLVRLVDGGFLALYHKCTHLDCVVLWDEETGDFHCPCHGSRFEVAGAVMNPPAPRPLSRFSVSFEDGMVLVDTGTLLERRAVEPADAGYATDELPDGVGNAPPPTEATP